MSAKAQLRGTLKALLRRGGWELRRHRTTVSARRAELFQFYCVSHVVDIGANRGQWALALRESGYSGAITSIEPVTTAYAELLIAARHDPDWVPINVGVAESSRVGTINVTNESAFSSLLDPGPYRAAGEASCVHHEEQVQLYSLDQICRMCVPCLSQAAIKLDIQGAELDVLRAAPEVIAGLRMIELEMASYSRYQGEPSIDEVVAFIYANGFRLCLVENGYSDTSGASTAVNGIFLNCG